MNRPAAPLLVMHIPKTAGTTLRWIVERQYPQGKLYTLYPGNAAQIEALAEAARAEVPAAVIGHFRFGLHTRLPSAAGYVTFLRDPVDRVVSHYNYLVGAGDPDNRGVLNPGDGLAEFATHDWARNLQTQFVTGMQAAEVDADPDGAVRLAASLLTEHFVHVGVAERFAGSIHAMAVDLGWRVPYIPRLNPSPESARAVRRDDVPQPVIRKIEATNRCDRALHDYVRSIHRHRWWQRPVRTLHEKAFTTANWVVGQVPRLRRVLGIRV